MEEIKDWISSTYKLMEYYYVNVYVKINDILYVYNTDMLDKNEGAIFQIHYFLKKKNKKVSVFKDKGTKYIFFLDNKKEIILKGGDTLQLTFKINSIVQPVLINLKVPRGYNLYLYLNFVYI